MECADNCMDAKLDLNYCLNKSLVLQFVDSKGIKTGENHIGSWHVYDKPHRPHFSMHSSFSHYLLTRPQLPKSGSTLFGWINQYGSKSKIFMSIAKEHVEELKYFGMSEDDIGTHS